MLLDIVILPPKTLRNKIGSTFKKEITKFDYVFTVDNKKLIPHLSLWHLKTSEAEIDRITQELKKVIKKQRSISITTTGLEIDKEYKECLSLSVRESKTLNDFQQKVFQTIHHLRTGVMPQFAAEFRKWRGKMLEEAKEYGKPLGFNPHLTAGWMKNDGDAKKVIKNVGKLKFTFLVKEIYICEVNEWWQVKKIIKKIKFKEKPAQNTRH